MNAYNWPAERARLDWFRRCNRVAARVTKSDCWKCGGEDFIHSSGCKFALRGLGTGSAAMQFGNAVVRVVRKREFAASQRALMAALWAALR